MPTSYRGALALHVIACALLVATTSSAPAQNRYEWTVYSALNSVKSVAFDREGMIWAGTTGGVVGYHPDDDSAVVYRTTDGLLALNTTAIAVDPATGSLYAGGANGAISIRSADGSGQKSMSISALWWIAAAWRSR